MPLTVALSIAQNNGLPNTIVVTDSSTGSDPTITTRRLYLYIADNSTLVPDGTTTPYIEWPIAEGPLTLNVLERDYAVMIVGQWLAGAVVTYTYTNYYQFNANTLTFLFGLSTSQSAQMFNPNLLTSTNFFLNKAKVWAFTKDAANAINFGNDLTKAQLALDMAYGYIINEDKYF